MARAPQGAGADRDDLAEHHRAEEAGSRRGRSGEGGEQDRRPHAGSALSYAFDAAYVEDTVLRDGTAIRLRLIRAEDKDQLRDGFAKLSPESRYLRFFAPKHHLTDAELRYLTEVDGVDHLAIIAARLDEGREVDGLGVARFIRAKAEPTSAEAAIAVLDEVHGQGLGTLLFLRLVAAAAERGIERFHCEVLGENAAMVDMIAGFAPDRSVEVSAGVLSIEFALPAVPPRIAAAEAPRESPMFRLFRKIAEGALEWRQVVRRRPEPEASDAAEPAAEPPAAGPGSNDSV